jgi:hypothetical protein
MCKSCEGSSGTAQLTNFIITPIIIIGIIAFVVFGFAGASDPDAISDKPGSDSAYGKLRRNVSTLFAPLKSWLGALLGRFQDSDLWKKFSTKLKILFTTFQVRYSLSLHSELIDLLLLLTRSYLHRNCHSDYHELPRHCFSDFPSNCRINF